MRTLDSGKLVKQMRGFPKASLTMRQAFQAQPLTFTRLGVVSLRG